MKISQISISNYIGIFCTAIITMLITVNIRSHLEIPQIVYAIMGMSIYFLLYCLLLFISACSWACADKQKYLFGIIIQILICWFDIVYSVSLIKIMLMCYTKKPNNITKYFNNKDERIQYIALYLCAYEYDKNIVIQWFEDKYIKKNLPIDSDFYPIYKDLIKPVRIQ